MPKLRVTIIDEVRNRRLKVDLPDDAAMEKLLPALAKKLGLPATDPSGQPSAYRLTHEATGQALSGDQSLASFGVGEGDALRLAVAKKKVPKWAWGSVGGVVVLIAIAGVFLASREAKPEPTPTVVAEVTIPAATSTDTPRPAATPVAPTDTPVPPTKAELGTEDNPTIWSFVPFGEMEQVAAGAESVADLLNKETGLVIKTNVATEYADVVEAMCSDPPETHMASLDTFSYVLAADRGCAEAELVSVRYGSPTYNGQIIARADSGITSIADLAGKTFCRPAPSSTSGWIIPMLTMRAEGINPEADLAEIMDAGSHDAVVAAVYDGECDAGATYVDARGRIEEDSPDVMDKVVVIAITEDIPNDGLQYVPSVPRELRDKINDALLKIAETEEGQEALETACQWNVLEKHDDSFYDPFRQVLQASGMSVEDLQKYTVVPQPTDAPVAPTFTSLPPMATPVPPMATPMPPTDTPVPPTPVPVSIVEDEWGLITIPGGQPIKVGLAGGFSGDFSGLGVPIQQAALMAVDEVGVIKGHHVVMVSEDSQCDGDRGRAVAQKFAADPLVVGVVGHMCSSACRPASEVYDQAHLIMISPSCTSPSVTERGLKNVFRTCWNDGVQGKVAAEYALNVLGVSKAAVIHDKSGYGQNLAESFMANFEAGGGNVMAYESIDQGGDDFTLVLGAIAPKAPELIYFGGLAREAAILVRQMKELGISALFMSGEGAYDERGFIEAAGGAAEGAFVTFPRVMVDQWKVDYWQRWGEEPGMFSAHSYDAAKILLKAIEQVSVEQPDGSLVIGKKALADAVRTTEYDGLTGKIIFDERGDPVTSIHMLSISKVENGAFK